MLGLVLAGLAFSLLYGHTLRREGEAYEHLNRLLQELRQQDADLNQNVLQLRYRGLANYDALSAGATRLQRLAAALAAVNARTRVAGDDPRAGPLIAALERVVRDKVDLIERFKSRNAVLHNSLRYFPTAAQDALDGAAQGGDPRAGVALRDLRREMLLFALFGEPSLFGELGRLASARRALAEATASGSTAAVLTHAHLMLDHQPEIERLVRALVNSPLPAAADRLAALYTVHYENFLRRHGAERALFGTASLALLLYVAYALRRLKTTAAEMHRQANHDALTGLANRKRLYAELEGWLARRHGSGPPTCLLLLDLDRFKDVNDTLGHAYGDFLLRDIGPRLEDALPAPHLLARLGGDEFAVILPGVCKADAALGYAERLLAALRQPFDLKGVHVEVGGSVGIALSGPEAEDAGTLMRHADVAMYVAKQNHSGAALYHPGLDQHSPRRLAIRSELSGAIRDGQLCLAYQPKMAVAGRVVQGVEALVRWQHPRHGLIPPYQFVPVAELGNLIHSFTEWVVNAAIAQAGRWQAQGLDVRVAINLSARNLVDDRLPERLAATLRAHGVPAERLEIEITESAVMADPERARDVLNAVRRLGVRVTVDDFGTGYSSLAYLKRLPIQALKIDRSFVSRLLQDEDAAVIVHSTVQLAHNLGLKVVAEGVEDLETLDVLEIIGCDEAQGFFLSKPLDADECTRFLWQHAPVTTPAAANSTHRPGGSKSPMESGRSTVTQFRQ